MEDACEMLDRRFYLSGTVFRGKAIDSCEICYLCSTKRTKIKQNET